MFGKLAGIHSNSNTIYGKRADISEPLQPCVRCPHSTSRMTSKRQTNLTNFFKNKSEDRKNDPPPKRQCIDLHESTSTDEDVSKQTEQHEVEENRSTMCSTTLDQSLIKTTAKYCRDSARKIRPEWFIIYPWLKYITETNTFECCMCKEAKLKNVFTTGKDASKPKKDDFAKHEMRSDHRAAVERPKQQKSFEKAAHNAHESVREAIIAQMRNVLYMTKEAIPLRKATSLINLQILNVSLYCLYIFIFIYNLLIYRKQLKYIKKYRVHLD